MIEVRLGNMAAKEAYKEPVDPASHSADALRSLAESKGVSPEGTKEMLASRLSDLHKFRALDGERETVIVIPDGVGLIEALLTVAGGAGVQTNNPAGLVSGLWSWHSDEPPAWVEVQGDDGPVVEALRLVLAAAMGEVKDPAGLVIETRKVKQGRPKGWSGIAVDPHPDKPGRSLRDEDGKVKIGFLLFLAWLLKPELRVDAGKDFQSRVMSDTASTGTGSYAAANYIALTENAGAPAAGDTTLTGELAAASGGLVRAQATYAHTGGASTYTLTKTYTMNANDGTTRTIQKIGVFNAASTGTLVFETAVPNPPVLVPGDQLQITETVTI